MSGRMSGSILHKLRALMRSCPVQGQGRTGIQAYVVPSSDAHMSEYVADCDKRRGFISGFTGSAGTAIITENKAALWTDGRYYLQAQSQMDSDWILMKDGLINTPTGGEWLCKELPSGGLVGADPFLLSAHLWKQLSEQLDDDGLSLVPIETNLIDQIWDDQLPRPSNHISVQLSDFCGQPWQEKIKILRNKIQDKNCSMVVITALDEIAWMLNLRGKDIDFNPVFFSYMLVTLDNVFLFLDPRQVTNEIRTHLKVDEQGSEIPITLMPYSHILPILTSNVKDQSGKIWVSERTTNQALFDVVPKRKRITGLTPVAELKAVKNKVEINGMINCHIRDAVALCEYLHWLEVEVPSGNVTEISGSNKLEKFRKQQEKYVSLSFDTISASGSNGAIIHYRSSPETDRPITMEDMYLVDSGAQYRDGTTDVTRTVHFGTPTAYEKECFTRVLQGHIALASMIFPNEVKGSRLDALARASLWKIGLDYCHGTGHGVGSFLNVHEGPCGISYRYNPVEVALKENMVLSNEPGYYEDGKFGIRIESLIIVRKAETPYNFCDKGSLKFETITPVPIQTKLINTSLLNEEEIKWVNNFHLKCRSVTGEALKAQGRMETYQWLMKETLPL